MSAHSLFLNRVLRTPSYGWKDNRGRLAKPDILTILREFLGRLNVFADRRNWIIFHTWFFTMALLPFFILYLKDLSWASLAVGFVYSMIILGSYGTVWYHRYSTHHAFKFSNSFCRFIVRNMVPKIFPEEIYVISHHTHHAMPDKPGDPYNALAGGLYCFLADANHQPIALDLNRKDYQKVADMLIHTGIKPNTYQQYKKWGSVAHPARTIAHFVLNWSFWYSVFYLLGGIPLATTLFAATGVWAIGVRTFNYAGHGSGQDKRRASTDFNRADLSINQFWPGYVAGEWHNNHHLFPKSAQSGYQPHQIDLAWYFILFLSKIGAVSEFKNYKDRFYEKYYLPFKEKALRTS